MKIFLVAALLALVIYPSSTVPVFEKREYASRVRAAADGVVEDQETRGTGVLEVREQECPSGTCNVINVPPLRGGFFHDIGGYLEKHFQNIGEAATPALIAKIINREIIRNNRAKHVSSDTKVIDDEVSSSGTKIIGTPAPNNNLKQPSDSRWITIGSDRIALQSTFKRRVPVLLIPRGADIGDIRESDIPKFTVPLSFLTTFNRTPKIAPAPVSLKPGSGPASWEPYKVPQRKPPAPSPWETSKVPGQPTFVILDDSDYVSEYPEGNPQPENSGPQFVILQDEKDEEDVSQPPNKKPDGLIYIKPENPREPVKYIGQTYGVPRTSPISPEDNLLPHRVYDRPVLPPARSSISSVSSARISVPKSKLPTTKRDGMRVTKIKSRKPDGTRVTKTKSQQPDGTRVIKTKSRQSDGTRVIKTKSRQPDGTRVTNTKTRRPDGTKITRTKSQERDGSKITRTTSEQPDGIRVTKIDNSEILDETVIVSNDDVTEIDFLEDGQKSVNEQDSILISKDGKLLQGAKDGRDIKITQKDGVTIVDIYDDSDDDEEVLSQPPDTKPDGLIYVKPENPRRPVKDIAQAYGIPPILPISPEDNPLAHKIYNRPVLPPAPSSIPSVSHSRLSVPKSKLPTTKRDGTRVTKTKSRRQDGTRVNRITSKQPEGTRVTKIDNSEILDETVIVSNDDVTEIDFLEDGQKSVNEQDSILISKDGKLLQGAKDGRDIIITQKDGVTIVDLYDDSDDDEEVLSQPPDTKPDGLIYVKPENPRKPVKAIAQTNGIPSISPIPPKKNPLPHKVYGRPVLPPARSSIPSVSSSRLSVPKSKLPTSKRDVSRVINTKSQRQDGTRVNRITSKQQDGTRVTKIDNSEILDETVIVSNDDVTEIDFLEDGQKSVNEQDSILISKDGKLLQGAKDGRDIKITQKDGVTIVDLYDDSDDEESVLITDENDGKKSTNQVTKSTSDSNVIKKSKVVESDQRNTKRSHSEIKKSKIVKKGRDTKISKTVANDVNISKSSKYSATGIQRPDISPAFVEGSTRPHFIVQDSNESEEDSEEDTDDETVLTANGNVSIDVENEGSILVKKDGTLVREAGDKREVVVKKVGDDIEVDIWDDDDEPDVEGFQSHVYVDSSED